MNTPEFYERAPRIAVHDPLAELLGAAEGGRMDYGYVDAVKLAGHSCPTVAGAFLMLVRGLARLFPDEPAERGAVLVEIPEALEDGTAGVTGAVATLITGAAGAGGFKGLAGRYSRRDLLRYGAAVAGDMRLTRIDSGRAATLSYHAEIVPLTDALRAAMGRALQPGAQPQERAAFAVAWQERVKAILIDHADDPRLVTLAD